MVHVGATLEQQLRNVRVATAGCPKQRCPPGLSRGKRDVQVDIACTNGGVNIG